MTDFFMKQVVYGQELSTKMHAYVCALCSYNSNIIQINQVERLKIRLQVMMFMGNFEDDIALLSPVSLS